MFMHTVKFPFYLFINVLEFMSEGYGAKIKPSFCTQ